MQMSYNRLAAYKSNDNRAAELSAAVEAVSRKKPNLKIPELLAKVIPIHWSQFLAEANNELS